MTAETRDVMGHHAPYLTPVPFVARLRSKLIGVHDRDCAAVYYRSTGGLGA